jgi:hypothetical protein
MDKILAVLFNLRIDIYSCDYRAVLGDPAVLYDLPMSTSPDGLNKRSQLRAADSAINGSTGVLVKIRARERGYVPGRNLDMHKDHKHAQLRWQIEKTYRGNRVVVSLSTGAYQKEIKLGNHVALHGCLYTGLSVAFQDLLHQVATGEWCPFIVSGLQNYMEDHMHVGLIPILNKVHSRIEEENALIDKSGRHP